MKGNPEFDIREGLGLASLAKHHVLSKRKDNLEFDEIVKGLQSLVSYLGPRDWMVWRYGCFIVPAGHKHQRILSVHQAVELGAALESVSACDGFDEFLLGFNNPTQFDDTFFEVQMADWCLKQSAIKSSVLRHNIPFSLIKRNPTLKFIPLLVALCANASGFTSILRIFPSVLRGLLMHSTRP